MFELALVHTTGEQAKTKTSLREEEFTLSTELEVEGAKKIKMYLTRSDDSSIGEIFASKLSTDAAIFKIQ